RAGPRRGLPATRGATGARSGAGARVVMPPPENGAASVSVNATGSCGPAGGKRERTKAQNRGAIVDAAREVFAELGYDAAAVRDVIRRTDLASGTFYNYFPDKETVFRTMLDESAREVRRRLLAVRAGAHTLEEFVGDAYRAWFEFLVEDRLMFGLVQRNADTIRAMVGDPILGAGVRELLDDLRAAIERGDMPLVDADYL